MLKHQSQHLTAYLGHAELICVVSPGIPVIRELNIVLCDKLRASLTPLCLHGRDHHPLAYVDTDVLKGIRSGSRPGT